ncbi:MAG: hypothetical protein PHH43_05645 [Candidatus Cloacimonetes bacterium]|nr:hypothetical protein [Candidatus Cloacimonadota bacterium]MDD3235793.1 hypothetical protein [Candidatus Cloacimonadota bacterium]
MKNYYSIFLLLLLLSFTGKAVGVSCYFSPSSVELNTMNTISFDPNEPLSQPMLTTLTINDITTRIELMVSVYWNGNQLVDINFESVPGASFPGNVAQLNNRQLISNQGDSRFMTVGGDISVEDVINSNPLLKDAVLAGYFPDGNLELRVKVQEYASGNWTEPNIPAVFTIKIRNAGAINLQSPGVAIGQTPPQISERPVSFFWNSVSTGFAANKNTITIREYPPNNPPNPSSVGNTGNIFHTNTDVNSGFAEFLPFNPGNYYAWQISTQLVNEFTHNRSQTTPTVSKSNWYVFKFVNESDNESQTVADMQAQLNFLDSDILRNLLTQGYTPVGTVIYEGRTYTGQDALDLLSGLVGKEIEVQIKD